MSLETFGIVMKLRLGSCKTIAHDPLLCKKRPKERVSILATCNTSGYDPYEEGDPIPPPIGKYRLEKKLWIINVMEDSKCSSNNSDCEEDIRHELQLLIDID
ncbi:6329_t:CDS:2 [Rhizophagus irregularis]|nr:6329_t:CDS:2 [Rhizophagus irregularis]